MCIVCVLWDKQKLTTREAMRALYEEVEVAKSEQELKHMEDLYEVLAELDKRGE